MEFIVTAYRYITEEKPDPRSASWLLISSPWPMILLSVLYVTGVPFGQRIMANRAAFEMKEIMIVYNFSLVMLCAYIMYEFIVSSWIVPDFNFHCATMDILDDSTSIRLASAVWWYFFTKIIEYADTVIFVLRKKNNQITFLHVYHHLTMPLLWWIGTRIAPGGEAYFPATVNCFVHIVMYSYYMLSALGPKVQPYLWWKKYLTILQLLQFLLVILKTSYTVYTNCSYPIVFQKMQIVYMCTFVILFSNFFYKTYHHRPQKQHIKAASHLKGGGEMSNGFASPVNVVSNEQALKKDD